MTMTDAFIAANRFGYGARPGELSAIARDPRDWLSAQIAGPTAMPAALAGLPSAQAFLAAWAEARREPDRKRAFRDTRMGRLYDEEALARTLSAIGSDAPFRERLVHFWSNHFTVSAASGRVRAIAGTAEREAIRPHVAGRFADMLIAVTKHPTMLLYLDNVASIGPGSPRGVRRKSGLNENLAREILELHTLGVNGGYRQADVIALAKIITGWRITPPRRPTAGRFFFDALAHEPGAKRLLGRIYREGAADEGEAALRDLARHPATARFVAEKLARHFVADDPPRRAVTELARVFTQTDGDLNALSRALIGLPEAWSAPLSKVKTPNDLVISAWRLLGGAREARDAVNPLRVLGQMPFWAPSPAGWPDDGPGWAAPEAMLRRIEIAALAGRRRPMADAVARADDALGPVLGKATRAALAEAESASDATALLLASPEFQRR
jgi:uncharacterized protein (DUF1800 family)